MAKLRPARLSLRHLAAPAVAVGVAGVLAAIGAAGRIDRAWFDQLQRTLAPSAPPDPATALVLIDEQSLEAMGSPRFAWRWPWPRQAFAGLLAGLHRAGAKAVVADLAFVEHSGSEMDEMLLGAVAAGSPEVTLASLGGKLPVCWPPELREQHAALFAGRPRWGSANARADADGVFRRYPPSGTLVDAALGGGPQPEGVRPRLLRWHGGLEALRAQGVPVLPAARFVAAGLELLEPATEQVPGLDPAALVGAIEAQPVTDEEAFALVRGRTVFVGANAAAAFDAIATPAGSPEPGVLLHWHAWQNAVGGAFLAEAGAWAGLAALLATAGLVGASAAASAGLRVPGLVAGSLAAAALGGSAAAFRWGWWVPPAMPVLGAAAAFSAAAVEGFRRERARKREIEGWFGSYVSPAVVERLIANPESLALGGERRELTVAFSDLAGFTTLSEHLPPDRLVSLVNVFLEHLTECVLRHGGYVDKYIGDAIMAVFGSPEALDNHALAACHAALDSQRCLATLNDRFAREHGVRLGMRIGINTGEMVVGNIGSPKKRNYTVLGDAVNLASRLEGANKEFGTSILVGPVTASRVAGELVTRPVARLRVKGKAKAVDVHALIGEAAALDAASRRFLDTWSAAHAAFGARDFAAAARGFEVAAKECPDDRLAHRFLAEARRLAADPPGPDWEPVLTLESK